MKTSFDFDGSRSIPARSSSTGAAVIKKAICDAVAEEVSGLYGIQNEDEIYLGRVTHLTNTDLELTKGKCKLRFSSQGRMSDASKDI